MSTNKDPAFDDVVKNGLVQIKIADTTVAKTVFTAGTDGATINQLTATTDDTSAVTLSLAINDGTLTNIIGQITVPIGSGTTTTPATNLFNPDFIRMLQEDGSLVLEATNTLEVNATVTVTSGKTVYVTAAAGDL